MLTALAFLVVYDVARLGKILLVMQEIRKICDIFPVIWSVKDWQIANELLLFCLGSCVYNRDQFTVIGLGERPVLVLYHPGRPDHIFGLGWGL